jgi:hypothetical protein
MFKRTAIEAVLLIYCNNVIVVALSAFNFNRGSMLYLCSIYALDVLHPMT